MQDYRDISILINSAVDKLRIKAFAAREKLNNIPLSRRPICNAVRVKPVLLVFAITCLLISPAAAQANDNIQVVSLAPAAVSTAGETPIRQVFSPDGDGYKDSVEYTIQTTPFVRVQLAINYWMIAENNIVTLGPLQTDAQGFATFVWDGKDGRGRYLEDGGYNLTFCRQSDPEMALEPLSPTTDANSAAWQCSARADIAVQVRSLSVTLPAATVKSVPAGGTTEVDIFSDNPGSVTGKLTSEDGAVTYLVYPALHLGINYITIPATTRPGEYRLHVDSPQRARRDVQTAANRAPKY